MHKRQPWLSKDKFPFLGAVVIGLLLLAMILFALQKKRDSATENSSLRPTEFSKRVGGAFEIRRVTLEEFPQWLREQAQNREWENHAGDHLALNRETLEASLKLGQDYLLNNQKAAGNFNYSYDFRKKKIDQEDNQVRQAGALWGLSLLYQYRQSDQTRAALDRALDFFLNHTCPGGTDGDLAIAYPQTIECQTGTVALTALAIIEYLHTLKVGHTTLSEGRRQILESTLDGYIRFLESMRLANKHFSDSWSLSKKRKGADWNPYCDGEVLLCFVKAAKYLERSRLVPLIEEIGLEFAKCYTVDEWNTTLDSDLTKGFFQWSCLAFWEYRQTQWKHAKVFDDYLLTLGWWMLHIHHILERTRNTGYAYEGIIPIYAVASERVHPLALNELGWTIDQGLMNLTTWQVGGPLKERNAFLMSYPTMDSLAVGGIMNAKDEPALRIDVTQHQMHAVMLALQHAYRGHPKSEENR